MEMEKENLQHLPKSYFSHPKFISELLLSPNKGRKVWGMIFKVFLNNPELEHFLQVVSEFKHDYYLVQTLN